MSNVTIHLEREAQQSLTEKANRGGQTLEIYLQQIVEEHIRSQKASDDSNPPTNEDELVERPWRGVFVPDRPRNALFSRDVSAAPEQLLRRLPNVNMNWHRQISNDE